MKFSDRYQYTVLCEDKKTFHFINNILKHQNINVHRIDPIISPRAAGSGEAFVRNTYIKQLKALRSTNYIKRALIVCTDADTHTVDERKKWFSTVCSSSTENIQERKENEPVMIWIPKRSIENWIEYFKNDSNDVTEDTKYEHNGNPVKCTYEASKMSEYLQNTGNNKNAILPSIQDAKNEYIQLCNSQKE
ncbi:MAG: hypothetical protein IJ661_00500 [Lachnospiraceae bacterium]|nr:hypothetical protein [Lachnospiraceae bacterium]